MEDQSPDLNAVTRRFLEEIFAEADIPAELMEVIAKTYEQYGMVTMSEDGGRYFIGLR